jgi:hypothetical protein
MNPVTFSLCGKPVIGIIMFAATLCAFPPLFRDRPLPLQQGGATVIEEVEAPISKPYFLDIDFTFPPGDTSREREIVGSSNDERCLHNDTDVSETQSGGLGRSIPVRVLVREQRSSAVIIDKVFHSLCVTGGTRSTSTRTAARLDLAAGRYIIEVQNLKSQAGLEGVKTTVSLVAGHVK